MRNTTHNEPKVTGNQNAEIDTSTIRSRSRKPQRALSSGEVATGGIICTQDLRAFKMVDAALNAWSARQRTMGLAVVLLSAVVSVGSTQAQTVETSPAVQPVAEVCDGRMSFDEFFLAYPDADGSDYDDYCADADAFEQGEREGQDNAEAEMDAELSAYVGDDVDNGSAEEN